jgi:AcrR family transcriptional regulator
MAMKTPRHRNRAAKTEAIVEATRELIGEKGYSATSTNHIAKAAGVSVGLVYKYFPAGKDDITYQISLRDHSSIVETLFEAQVKESELPKRLHRMFVAWIKQHQENEPFLRAMNISMLSNPRQFRGYVDVVERTAGKMHSLFWPTEGRSSDSSEHDKKLTLALFHMIESVIHRHILSARMFDKDEELAEFLTKIVINVVESHQSAQSKRHF